MRVLSRGLGVAAIATTVALGLASMAQAADMDEPIFGAAPPLAGVSAPPPEDPIVTFGTGWYLRGDLGVAEDIQIGVGNAIVPKRGGFPNAWSLTLGAGYKFNNWVRADMTLDWRAPRKFSGNTSTAACITAWPQTGTDAFGTPIYTPSYGTCADLRNARINNTTLLFNIYADLGTWWGLTPYVGAGIGANYVYQKNSQDWYMLGNGQPYHVTATAGTTTYYYNWDNAYTSTSWQLAWALMAGLSYAVTPNVAVDFGARYMNLGSIQSISNYTGFASSKSNTVREVRIGLRYTPD